MDYEHQHQEEIEGAEAPLQYLPPHVAYPVRFLVGNGINEIRYEEPPAPAAQNLPLPFAAGVSSSVAPVAANENDGDDYQDLSNSIDPSLSSGSTGMSDAEFAAQLASLDATPVATGGSPTPLGLEDLQAAVNHSPAPVSGLAAAPGPAANPLSSTVTTASPTVNPGIASAPSPALVAAPAPAAVNQADLPLPLVNYVPPARTYVNEHGKIRFPCNRCPASRSRKDEIRRHLRSAHYSNLYNPLPEKESQARAALDFP
ncbi:uncharacterized protein CTRU02_204949 [Colletotrichum truncatum]|uniref:Uncharacterized protein n=1 Tax=Colletotrichum truncatum TaxID=5467 RepID=A0ACC3Z2N4_COLTU